MNDLISREALKKVIEPYRYAICGFEGVLALINNAPAVEYTFEEAFQKTICEQRLYCPKRPKGEYEFIEILAQYVPDDICTYPEYKGKPYYSIHYKKNGEEFVGFGTYNPEVLSRYLKEYFMKGVSYE